STEILRSFSTPFLLGNSNRRSGSTNADRLKVSGGLKINPSASPLPPRRRPELLQLPLRLAPIPRFPTEACNDRLWRDWPPVRSWSITGTPSRVSTSLFSRQR